LDINPNDESLANKKITFHDIPAGGIYRLINKVLEKGDFEYGRPFISLDTINLLKI